MTQHGDDSGRDDGRRPRRDDSVWAQASREDAEDASPSGDSAGGETASPDRETSDRETGDRPSTDRPSTDRPSTDRPSTDRPSTDRPGTGRPRPDRDRDRRQTRPRQVPPGPDVLTDLQRWLLRNSARTMRKEITGQVRRTFGGGRKDSGDVWDTATTEIPLGVGEAPECQWCPICRAARRMRDSGPNLGDHLSTAGDVVAAAVQDALGAVDTVLSRTAGPARPAPPDPWAADGEDWQAARDSWAAAHGARTGRAEPPGDDRADQVADDPADQGTQEGNQQPEGPDEPDNRG
jgi:hypothetical protein